MKILIPTGAFPPEIGGPATYVPRLANALCNQGHDVTVMTYTSANGFDDTQFPFKIIRLNVNGRLHRWLHTVWQLIRQIRQHEVVYVNGLLFETAVATLFVRRPMLAKVVGDIAWERARDKGWVTDNIDTFQKRVYELKIEVRRSMRDWSIHRMRHVIVPSQYLYKIVSRWFVDPRLIQIIYNAYEPPFGKADSINFPLKNQQRLITVCRLVNWKGVDGIIEMVSQLPNTDLLIVGDGPERETLTKLVVQKGISDRVHFTGNLPHEGVMAALKTADLFVLNSIYEGLPHVLLEALAMGVPIVATRIGGTPEVVVEGENGRLTPINNLPQLTQTVSETLQQLDQYQVELPQQFTLENMINQTIELILHTGTQHA